MKKLGLKDGDKVKVTTKYGSVVIKGMKSRRIRSPNTIFIPYGPWANLLVTSDTEGTGMPLLKGVQADVKPTDEKFLSLRDLLAQSYDSRSIGEKGR